MARRTRGRSRRRRTGTTGRSQRPAPRMPTRWLKAWVSKTPGSYANICCYADSSRLQVNGYCSPPVTTYANSTPTAESRACRHWRPADRPPLDPTKPVRAATRPPRCQTPTHRLARPTNPTSEYRPTLLVDRDERGSIRRSARQREWPPFHCLTPRRRSSRKTRSPLEIRTHWHR